MTNLSTKEIWDRLEESGMVPKSSDKEIKITCEKVTELLKTDKSILNTMTVFSHLLECESCRNKSQEKK